MRALTRAARPLRALAHRVRSRRSAALLGALVLGVTLVPVFQANVLAPGDSFFFSNWDRESQALVLGGIERAQVDPSPAAFGLQGAAPNVLSPYDTFDALQDGTSPTASRYLPYTSSLGLQGRMFDGAYRMGCSTLNCLNTVESGLFSFVFVLFGLMLIRITRLSFAVVVMTTCLLSPWVVSSAHNLYWVPWTWLLPSMGAGLLVLVRSRTARWAAVVAVGAATALKSTTGYEFLTTTTLLAASMPVLAHLLGRRRTWRSTFRDAALVLAASVGGFLVVLTVHAVVSGDGSILAGLQAIAQDAMKRTYGSPSLGADGVTVESLRVSPLRVLALYLVDWRSSVLAIGTGGTGPVPAMALGPGAFWSMIVVAAAITVVGAVRDRGPWRRDAALLITGAAPAVSWFVLGKSHSWTATSINFVLWYWIFVPILVWLILAAVWSSAPLRSAREALGALRGSQRESEDPPSSTRRLEEPGAQRSRQVPSRR